QGQRLFVQGDAADELGRDRRQGHLQERLQADRALLPAEHLSWRAAWLGAALLLICASSAAAKPRCYGAAAGDPVKTSPSTGQTLRPTPDEALITPNVACTRGEVGDMATSCAVGEPAEKATATVAMLGDSHAGHWRAAMEAVAMKKDWRVLEIARP